LRSILRIDYCPEGADTRGIGTDILDAAKEQLCGLVAALAQYLVPIIGIFILISLACLMQDKKL
jgi:hypothetical protein